MITKSKLEARFKQQLKAVNRQGDLGIANFRAVYENLMPVQQQKLEKLCGENFPKFVDHGTIVCIALSYYENEIHCINQRSSEGKPNKELWNNYAQAYNRLNNHLNRFIVEIAELINGIAIPATLEGMVDSVQHVTDYFPLTISHRAIAEHAGLGWRGKNELIVHPRYSCAIRFASVLTDLPLPHDKILTQNCGNCVACLEACSFLKHKTKIKYYRESCRKYILSLGLEDEVCGKCVLACYCQAIVKDQFQLQKAEIL
ncbi:MAG: hypothetical protein ACFFBD_08680 [Candidatus Hodarchaeota archaeon]